MSDNIPAVVYDIESFPNVFTFCAIDLNSDTEWRFEISDFKSDIQPLYEFLNWLSVNEWFMIGYNNIHYDYNLVHAFMTEPVGFTAAKFYAVSKSIITNTDRFGRTVWESDRYVKQIDLLKIHHFDNKNKRQSLKGIEANMRSDSVLEAGLSFDAPLTEQQKDEIVWPYNHHDVAETKRFAILTLPLIRMRMNLASQIRGDILNFNDTKIGKELLTQRIGDNLCYTRISGKREPRQTPRPNGIALKDCVFDYIKFDQPEFQRILEWIKQAHIYSTKGEVSLTATFDDFEFAIGTGGIHGSVRRKRFYSDDEWVILDDDVASLYPSVAIVNQIAPEHLGQRFVEEYANLKKERFKYAKDTPENSVLKLALNGTYGDSNSEYSVFYDPQFTMTITINGQMLLCMFSEKLMAIPTLSLIQVNTDGVSYRVHRSMLWMVDQVRSEWQALTGLELEQVEYKRMFIRDVNSYIAEDTKGKIKAKGAYWTPRNSHWNEDIINSKPPAFHKNLSTCVIQRAAVEHMMNGTDIATYVYSQTNPFDFMGLEKTRRTDKLFIGEELQGNVTRTYMSRTGFPMRKVIPSAYPGRDGQFKQARGVSDKDYDDWQQANGNVHNPTIHTKNKSVYESSSVTNLNAGHLVRECNHVRSFNFNDLDYHWYVEEARKLIF